jgi:alcohol dehydrogenase
MGTSVAERARALVLEAPRRLVAVERDVPPVRPDSGILRVEACGLCGTDHEQYTGALHPGWSFVPGHEVIGVVEALGPDAARRWGVAEGDRVALEVFLGCGECPACVAGEARRCAHHGLRTMYGLLALEEGSGLSGGYATHLDLRPDSRLLKVPDDLDPVLATAFNPLGAGIRWGARLPGTGPGDVVAVLGPGIRGLCVVAAAREAGAGFVMVTGVGARDAERLAWAEHFGADLTVEVSTEDPVVALRRATGGRADVVVDVTAMAPTAFAQAVALARTGGTVVVAGTRGAMTEASGFHPDDNVSRELRVLGALGVDREDYADALDLLATGAYPFADLPREVVGLDGAAGLLERMAGESGPPPPIHGVVAPAGPSPDHHGGASGRLPAVGG